MDASFPSVCNDEVFYSPAIILDIAIFRTQAA